MPILVYPYCNPTQLQALIENDVKPNYVYDIIIYSLRAIKWLLEFPVIQ